MVQYLQAIIATVILQKAPDLRPTNYVPLWCTNISLCWWWLATPCKFHCGITLGIDPAGQQLGNVWLSSVVKDTWKDIAATVGAVMKTVLKRERDLSRRREKGRHLASFLSKRQHGAEIIIWPGECQEGEKTGVGGERETGQTRRWKLEAGMWYEKIINHVLTTVLMIFFTDAEEKMQN